LVAKVKKTRPAKRSAAAETSIAAVTAEPTVEPIVQSVATPEPEVIALKTAKSAKTGKTAGVALFGFAGLPGFAEADVAAIAEANAALVKGFEAAGREVAGFAQQNMTQAVDAARALVGVRTVADLIEVNRNLAQATLDTAIAKSARLSEIGIRLATEALAPLGEQLAAALGRFARITA
jgi:hypothetical protein